MGLFWDLLQQSTINGQVRKTSSLEARVASLESELEKTRQVLRAVIERLEEHVGVDLDADGHVG